MISIFRVGYWLLIDIVMIVLVVFPLAQNWGQVRPNTLLLIMAIHILRGDRFVGVIYAWCLGLLSDLLVSGHIGYHALVFVVIAALMMECRVSMSNFSLLNKFVALSMVLSLYSLFECIVDLWLLKSSGIFSIITSYCNMIILWSTVFYFTHQQFDWRELSSTW